MPPAPEIAIATSIPPKMTRLQNGEDIGERYQADCVASWIEAGLKVYSVNVPEEIPALAGRFPQVEFIPTDRDARAVAGRKMPFIDDLLLALARQDRPIVGIVNADICLETGRDWAGAIAAAVPSSLLMGPRVDVETWPNGAGEAVVSGTVLREGFDLFFFEKTTIVDCLAAKGADRFFSIGVPAWDYWLPVALALKGYQLVILDEPSAAHFRHPTNWDSALWEYMTEQLAECVTDHGVESVLERYPAFNPMISWAQKLGRSAAREIEQRADQCSLDDSGKTIPSRYGVELALFSQVVLGTLRAAGRGRSP
ncbi:MAG: hypothetical protein WDN69_20065 [Aliidongia sp.]